MTNKNKTLKQPLNLKPLTGSKQPLNAKEPLKHGQPFKGNLPKDKNRDEKSGW